MRVYHYFFQVAVLASPAIAVQYNGSDGKPSFLKSLLKEFTIAKSHIDPLQYLSIKCDGQELVKVFNAFRSNLSARGLIEFADMVPLATQLLESTPHILSSMQRKYQHVLVDEFQDTNAVQCKLLLLLASQGGLTVVGDIDQLIYAFQGANRQNVQMLHKFFASKGVPVHTVALR